MAAPIVTPEAVVLDFDTAGIGSRLVAGLIDLALQGAALFAGILGATALASSGIDPGGVGAALGYTLAFAVIFGYPAAMETLWRGRTLGKAAMGLRVVTTEGAPVRFRHAAIRSIFSLVDWYVSQGLVGVGALLVTKRNQRVGDLVAGTIVLRQRSAAGLVQPVRFHPPPGLEGFAATIDTAALGHGDYGPVRSFLLRAPTMAPQVRHELAGQLAVPLVTTLRTPVPPGVAPEAFLVCVAAAYQRRMAALSPRAGGGFTSVWASPARGVRWVDDGPGEPEAATGDVPSGADGFAAPA